MTRRPTPKNASVAHAGEDGKLFAPSAARNVQALCDLLADVAPATGRALELASGTGQHVVAYGARLPALDWQPSEIAAERRASIDAYAAASGLANIAPALELDATRTGWGAHHQGQSLVVLSNLLHLISLTEATTLINEAARALAPGGVLVLYGPFKRGGELTSEGDAAFHASLIAQDPEIGYKDDFDMLDVAQGAGLETSAVIEMPANNLALILQKPGI